MLTDNQIQQLFAFTRKKHVHHYDVQVEIVDHLASAIEEVMDQDPKASFDEALQKVYKRFGIFGFTHVVQEKQQAVEKMNKQIWKAAVKEFFTIPKLFFSLALFSLSLTIGSYLAPEWRYVIFFIIWITLHNIEFSIRRRLRTKKEKQLLLTQGTDLFSLSIFFLWWLILIDKIESNFIFALLMVLLVISEMAMMQLSRHISSKAKELYPEAFAR